MTFRVDIGLTKFSVPWFRSVFSLLSASRATASVAGKSPAAEALLALCLDNTATIAYVAFN